ncbi:MAG: hypothetical protein JWR80_1605 [Bradyrhizobium sp.]|nr:hypothetical protein [Bradyrhizobium sp.]
MKYTDALSIAANWATILTALIASLAYGRFILGQWQRRWALERHLREEKRVAQDEGRRTVVHLMANLAMTEAEVLHAGFASSRVKAVPGIDEQGRAVRIYFEYAGDDIAAPRKY